MKRFKKITIWPWAMILVLVLASPAAAASNWVQLNPTPDPVYGTPLGRAFHTSVYTPATNRMIIFSGGTRPGGYGSLNDVWVLTNADGTGGAPAWIKLNPGPGPSLRYGQAAVYDQANNRMIIQGGHTMPGYCEGVVGDTWILTNADGTGPPPAWIPLNTTGTSPVQRYATPAYDAANNRMIIWGGTPAACGAFYDTYWVLTNANGLAGTAQWTQLQPINPVPSNFVNGPAGYDPSTNILVGLAGNYTLGRHPNVRLLNAANGLGGSPAWTDPAISGALPGADSFIAGAYDAARNRLVIYGGYGITSMNETWRLENANGQGGSPAWTQLTTAVLPPWRSYHSAVYNPGKDCMIIFGGQDSNGSLLKDVWVLTEAMGPAPNAPPTCNAGGDRSILSKDQGTTILNGAANDPEGDALTYRWLEGTTELATWQPVQNDQAPLNLGALPFFSLTQHSLTLEVSDGQVTSRDAMVLTVENSAPNAGPTGAGVYQVNTPVTLAGEVSDFDGDLLSYKWMKGTMELNQGVVSGIAGGQPVSLPSYIISSMPVGEHQIILQVSDGVNAPTSAAISVKVEDTTAPTLAPVASPTILWPPNHQMVPITITTNAQDNGGLPVTLTAQVSCNEPNDGSQYWTTPVIDPASGIITLQLQASRLGKGTGRSYIIDITATDQAGNTSSAKAVVTVPHDRGKN